jgi:hypothetical protein
MSDEPHIAGDTFPPQESGALDVDEAPLLEGDASLLPPVYLVECSPSHLALQARWYAPFLTLAPVGALCLTFLAGCCVFVWVVVAPPANGQLALQLQVAWGLMQVGWVPFLMLGVSALCMVGFVLFSWKFIRRLRQIGRLSRLLASALGHGEPTKFVVDQWDQVAGGARVAGVGVRQTSDIRHRRPG